MNISVSSFFITLCISSLLIYFFSFMIANTNRFKIFRTDFLYILILIIVLRIVLPFEFPFTITIVVQKLMNPLFTLLNKEVILGFKFSWFLLIIWMTGIIYFFIKMICIHKSSSRIADRIKSKAKFYSSSEFIDTDNDKKYTVLISNLVSSPMVFGFDNIIFLPDIALSNKEIKNVLYHEVQHIRNNDVIIKFFINIIVIVYWWFPPIYSLRKNVNLFLEVRVDDQVTSKMSSEERFDYTATLISIQKKIKKGSNNFSSSLFFINDSDNIISFRVNYLLDGDFLKRTNPIFLLILCIIPFISNGIILEPAYYDSELINNTMSLESINEKGYILQHNDETFSLVYNGKEAFLGNTIPKEFTDFFIIKESEVKP